jgi:hypothetical protein
MKELTSEERGIVIFLIENYFKSTHNFRGVEEVSDLLKKNTHITPESYCDLLNHFDLGSLLNNKKTVHTELNQINNSTKLPNNGFLEVNNSKITTVGIKDYITKEDLSELYKINDTGIEIGKINMKNPNELSVELAKINKKMGIKKCNLVWNNSTNKWFYVNFFPSNYYSEMLQSISKPATNIVIKFIEEPYIKLFSNSNEGCSIEIIERKNNFDLVKIKKGKNTFGNGNMTPQERYVLYKLIIQTKSQFFNLNFIKQVLNIPESKIFSELEYLVKVNYLTKDYSGNYIINERGLSN